MQEKVGKRSWVNIVIIVFLIILLVLTFFSNTIRNRNLSECTTATVGYGTIDSKVRGSGTVSAKESYELKASDTRKVKSVLVNNGQTVTAGEVLLVLEAGESSELAEEEETLRQMQLAYQRSVISAFSADYTVQNRAIEETQTAIDEAVAARDAMDYRPESVSEHKTNLDNSIATRDKAQNEYDAAQRKVDEFDLQIGSEGDDGLYDMWQKAKKELEIAKHEYGADYDELKELAKDRVYIDEAKTISNYKTEAAKDSYAAGKLDIYLPIVAKEFVNNTIHPYYAAYLNVKDAREGKTDSTEEALRENLTDAENALSDYLDSKDYNDLLAYVRDTIADNKEEYGIDVGSLEGEERDKYLDTFVPDYIDEIAKSAILSASTKKYYDSYTAWKELEKKVADCKQKIDDLNNSTSSVSSAESNQNYIKLVKLAESRMARKGDTEGDLEKYIEAEAKLYSKDYSTVYIEMSSAESAVENARDSYYNTISPSNSGEYKKLKSAADAKRAVLDTATRDVETKQTAYDKAVETKEEYDGYVATITQLQKTLEDQIFNLEQQQKADGKTQTLEWLDINEQKRKIDEQQAKVDELKAAEGEEGETEIKAPVSGVIREISIAPGNKTSPDGIILKIEIKDMGYSLSFSVTNEQAKLIRKGDTGELTNMWWGGNIYAEVTDIKSDPQNPRTNKMIYFSVTGDVSDGETLDLSVGRRSAEFDSVVPKAALKSDNNGDFVYVCTLKSSPLGNRYIAERVSVEVIARDDRNVAVSGALDYGAYVIVNSSLPISNGSQVRLAGQ
ncbi:MAG: HlyD family efflux transporter periplasmic adaptor subunit [Oscillospiraceae bacterium]|nr:HlyD family efflux transporter periplasmic adaptor subunit [Oscillospiraceae bacterium]